MSLPRRLQRLSVAEYLEAEKDSPVRHEYVDGQIFAMAGAGDRHNRIAGNFYNRLDNHLGDGPCEPFISDMKVWVSKTVYYHNDELRLESVGLTLTVADVYRRVKLPQRARRR